MIASPLGPRSSGAAQLTGGVPPGEASRTADNVCLELPLFQFHEEQDEDRPHPHGYRELRHSGAAGIEFFDTTVIHVEAVVDELLH